MWVEMGEDLGPDIGYSSTERCISRRYMSEFVLFISVNHYALDVVFEIVLRNETSEIYKATWKVRES